MKNLKLLFTSSLLLLSFQFLIGQGNFIVLNDATGYTASQQQLDSLNAAADKLISTIDIELPTSGQFKVFDVGFYLHERDYEGDFPEAFQRAIDGAAAQSPYYLLFGRQIDDRGVNSKIWIEFVFPEGDFICIDNSQIIDNLQESANESLSGSREGFYQKQKELLKNLDKILGEGFCCSNYLSAHLLKTGGEKTLARLSGCSINSTADQAIIDGLLSDTTWLVVLKKVNKVYSLYKSCQASEWKSKAELEDNGNGLIPFCIWENIQSSGQAYTPLDPPFIAGGTDGLSSSLEDIATDVYNLPSSVEGFVLSGRDYFLYEIFCDHDTWLTTKRLAVIIIALKNSSSSSWKDQLAYASFNLMFDDSEFVKAFFGPIEIPDRARCEDESFKANYESIKEGIDFIYLLVTDWKTFFATGNKIWEALKAQFIDMWGDVDGFEPNERYYHGYYGSKAAFEILGSVKKFLKFGKLTEWLDGQIDRLDSDGKNGFRKLFVEDLLGILKQKKPYIDWDDDVQKKFDKDFLDPENSEFAIWVSKNQDKIKAWEGLIDRPEWVRLNRDLLGKIGGKSDVFIKRVDEFYKNILLPGSLPRPLPSSIIKTIDGKGVTVRYNKYGFPEFGKNMTPIRVNGVIVKKKFNEAWSTPTSKNKADIANARTTDLRNATNWALKTDPSTGKFINFPDGKVRRKSDTKIEILDDDTGKWVEQTWHHHENGKDIIPVPTKLHNTGSGGLRHSGGMATRHGDVDISSIYDDYDPF